MWAYKYLKHNFFVDIKTFKGQIIKCYFYFLYCLRNMLSTFFNYWAFSWISRQFHISNFTSVSFSVIYAIKIFISDQQVLPTETLSINGTFFFIFGIVFIFWVVFKFGVVLIVLGWCPLIGLTLYFGSGIQFEICVETKGLRYWGQNVSLPNHNHMSYLTESILA